MRRAIARKLRAERWSPGQVSFWLRAERGIALSPEWIDRMIWDNNRAGGDRWRFLRRRWTHENRRGAQHTGRGVSPHRIDIAERPAIVAAKARLGDWERDTIVGAQRNGALLTHVERKSLFTSISTLPRPTATPRGTVHRLNPLRDHGHRITYDNGKAFGGHRDPADLLCAPVFFARPSHAWERGSNEHTHGLIRDVFPQGTNFTPSHPATVARVERLRNRRPESAACRNALSEKLYAHTLTVSSVNRRTRLSQHADH